MTNHLRSDSPTCRRIVLAFLDFLNSVQPAPGVDLEGVSVVKDCLEDVFKLSLSSTYEEIRPDVLIDLFSSPDSAEKFKPRAVLGPSSIGRTSGTTSALQQVEDSYLKVEDPVGVPHDVGIESKDELLGKFFAALDKINYIKALPSGDEDPVQIAKTTQLFNDAVKDMENSQGQISNLSNLAETFKLRGNQSMQSKLYDEAIERYTFAIALSEKNAVYYGNRAAAFTQVERYAEAIEDCLKAIKIDPSYSKAYSRLGFAYFCQGNYREALDRGFLKAVQLDTNNNSLKENIRAAQLKLAELSHRAASHQNSETPHEQASRARSAGPTNHGGRFPSFPIPPAPSAGPTNNGGPFRSFPIPPAPSATNHGCPFRSFPIPPAPSATNHGGSFRSFPIPPAPSATNHGGAFRSFPFPPTPSAGRTNHGGPFPSFPIPPAPSARHTNHGGPFPSFPIPPAPSARPTNHGGPFPPLPFPPAFSMGPTSTASPFSSLNSATPTELVDMIRTMGPTARSNRTNESRASGNPEAQGKPEIRMDANVSFDLGAAREQVFDALMSSMMGRFAPPPGPQQDMPRDSDRN